MNVAEYISKFLSDHKCIAKTVFIVSGGGNMYLIDSIARNNSLEYICNHHEQACTMAAEGFSRISNKIGVAIVTTGPGGTNAVTGVMGAWVDSIPMLVISGQVKSIATIASHPDLDLRQLGDQEINIVDIVRPITKYAVMVLDKNQILYHLEKAVYMATYGRPGPVWLDIPLDIQSASISEKELEAFNAPHDVESDYKIDAVIEALRRAYRPVMIVGNGIRLSGEICNLHRLISDLKIPVLTAISGVDLIESDHQFFFGRPGIMGARAANFILQNSDFVLILGARLNLRVVSYNWEFFVREAYKVMVDIDKNELSKKTLNIDLKIEGDLRKFIPLLLDRIKHYHFRSISKWLEYCNNLKDKYPVITPSVEKLDNYVSSYYFPILLSKYLSCDSVVVTGNGTAYTSTFQSMPIKKGQRLFANVGCASMGYDLPAAIGACFANNRKKVICITGDGSIQMNIQELQTIIHYKLPVTIFMYNNNGYLSIRITQKNFFGDKYVGESHDSGVSFPDMTKIANSYGFKCYKIGNHIELKENIKEIMEQNGPVFCELLLDPLEELGPKISSCRKDDGTIQSKPLEDLYPFLDRKEFLSNMLIDHIEE